MKKDYTLEDLRRIPIFFIVGKGRSGTTLLSTILEGHPNVASATESRFLLIVYQRYKNLKKWEPALAKQYIQTLYDDFRIQLFWEFEEGFERNLENLDENASVQDLIKLTYIYKKSAFEKSEIHFIVDKNPRYTLFIEKLSRIFSDSGFIRIIRDPRDNIASSIKYNKRGALALAYKWLQYNQRFDRFSKQYKRTITLSFEQLITDQESYFKAFESFTGIQNLKDNEQKRLTIKDEFESKLSEPLKEQHQGTIQPMNPKKVGHFKEKLNKEQIKYVEQITFPYAEKFGYQRAEDPISIPTKKLLKIKMHYRYKLYGNWLVYGLPYRMLIKARQFVFNYLSKGKKRKLDILLKELKSEK